MKALGTLLGAGLLRLAYLQAKQAGANRIAMSALLKMNEGTMSIKVKIAQLSYCRAG